MNIVCCYMGDPNECPECGGFNDTGQQFCSHDCAAAWADRAADHERQAQARRDNEEAFGREVDRLRTAGHTDEEIDVMLAGMPS